MGKYQQIAYSWEKRSFKYGNKIEGVLPKSIPKDVNNYLHKWMLNTISKAIENIDQKEIKILDLGCGYGRLSGELLKKFKNIKTFGVDISQHYVDLYNKALKPRGSALRADIGKLPFHDNQFELVFIVTTLMYLITKKDQRQAMSEIFRVAKPGAKIIIIERNKIAQNFLTLWGLVSFLRGRKNKEIKSVSFDQNYMINLIKISGGKVYELSGIPFWTLLLPFSIFFSHIDKRISRLFLGLVRFLDNIFNWLLTPSLYISYIVQKKKTMGTFLRVNVFVVGLLLITSLIFATQVFAQDLKDATVSSETVNSYEVFWPLSAGMVLGEPLYFLKNFKESFRGIFIFAQNKKIEYELMLSEKRVLEAEKLYLIKNDFENGRKTLDLAQKLREDALNKFKQFQQSGKSLGTLPELMAKSFDKQMKLLKFLASKVSDSAKSEIENNISKLNTTIGALD